MPVHIYGHPVDMDPLLDLAERHGLAIIEDAAEVHGAEYLSRRDGSQPVWRRCGGMGHISTFSFYANKLITTGEGGMVLTSDVAAMPSGPASLRNLCFRPERRFYHTELGYNYRLTNLQAALGVAQIGAHERDRGEEAVDGAGLHRTSGGGSRARSCRSRNPGPDRCTGCTASYWTRARGWTPTAFAARLTARGGDRPVLPGHARAAGLPKDGAFCRGELPGGRAHRAAGAVPALGAGADRGTDRAVCAALVDALA